MGRRAVAFWVLSRLRARLVTSERSCGLFVEISVKGWRECWEDWGVCGRAGTKVGAVGLRESNGGMVVTEDGRLASCCRPIMLSRKEVSSQERGAVSGSSMSLRRFLKAWFWFSNSRWVAPLLFNSCVKRSCDRRPIRSLEVGGGRSCMEAWNGRLTPARSISSAL